METFPLCNPYWVCIYNPLCPGYALGMEFKDYQWGGKPDIVDWLCTMAGGVVGQGLQALLLYLVL